MGWRIARILVDREERVSAVLSRSRRRGDFGFDFASGRNGLPDDLKPPIIAGPNAVIEVVAEALEILPAGTGTPLPGGSCCRMAAAAWLVQNGKKEFGTDALTGRSADRSNAGDLPGPCAYYRAMLINDLADIDNEVFVFLDDYHLVTDPAIRRAVSFLLRHAPSHLHLVLTTRLEPPLSLGGLLAKNRLLEVDASVLRFDYSFARPISSRGACLHPPRADGTVRDV
jgi:hypothetical protein